MTFYQKLTRSWKKKNSFVCVGLDTTAKDQFRFNKRIIQETHAFVCAYKPNTSFYEARGVAGIQALKKTCDFLTAHYPDIVLIIDAKRADIGNSNKGYASFVFDYLKGDACTLHPYLGKEALAPFLERKDKGSLILCRTSNSGAGEFQDDIYKKVAKNVTDKWNTNKNCGLVVGATYPGELKIVRRIAKILPLLIPGVGAQGGDLKKTLAAGLDKSGMGVIINASRSVIQAKDPSREAQTLKDVINKYR